MNKWLESISNLLRNAICARRYSLYYSYSSVPHAQLTPARDNLRQVLVCSAMVVALSACVTINVYFPAAAAEKAADRIIDEVLQSKTAPKPAAK